MLREPIPTRASAYFGNGVISNAKRGGNIFVDHAASPKFSYFVDLIGFGGSNRVSVSAIAAIMFHHIFHICFMGVISQICYAIVGVVSIIMANFHSLWAWADKRFCHKNMNTFCKGFAMFAQNNVLSSKFVLFLLQSFAYKLACAVRFVGDNPVKATNLSHVGDFVKAFKAGDGLPNLLHFLPLIVKSSVMKMQGSLHRNKFSGATLALHNGV